MRRRQPEALVDLREAWDESLLCTDPAWLAVREAPTSPRSVAERQEWESPPADPGWIEQEARLWLAWRRDNEVRI